MGKKKKKLSRYILLRDGFISTVLSLSACYLISWLFFNISFFNPISKALQDFSFLDVYYAEKLDEEKPINPNIILVNIENESRAKIAQALHQILKADPKVVGFDIILKDFKKTQEDSALAKYLKNEKVITAVILQEEQTISNHPFFRVKNAPGFVNFNFETQNAVIREYSAEKKFSKKTFSSFSNQIAKKFLSKKKWKKMMLSEKQIVPRVINYQGNLEHFMNFNTKEFMDLENKDIVKDKIVLLGYLGSPTGNTFDVEDKHFTPLNKVTAGKSIPDMHGMVIHANIIAMILSNDFMFKVPRTWIFLLTFLFSFLASIYLIWLDRRLKISYRTVRKAVLFVFAVLMVWISLVFFKYGIVLKTTLIIAVTVFSAGFVKYYKHLVRYVNTKRKFRSYLK
ncbi:hypothetical protein BFP77_09350 [Maribacter sp. 4U21]|uniref:CHASE2 domain-containing protein n=1 Tax=Maribacter sp. 4U21 TaxID=1889779 RepID=UPI000C156F01|nr:CHASE2 domain-containing protein [Maribacter sp. 4U21]PIB28824.1 hypothetical protein BFP77_09350 [Maribacter sp. 4U21]